MSDPVFTGVDVNAALAAAAEAVGRDVASLRYVVLDAGTPGGRGLSPTRARVAVILEKARPQGSAAPAERNVDERETAKSIRQVLEQLFELADLSLDVRVDTGEEAVVVSLSGRDRDFFIGKDGEGEALRSLEHLLCGMFGRQATAGRVVVYCEGFRERREEMLRQTALALAAEVSKDGLARETPPLNSYERRLVHMAASSVAGIVTYSVGEGADRRVTISVSGQAGAAERG
jgi:spoIIIJ-associated protein